MRSASQDAATAGAGRQASLGKLVLLSYYRPYPSSRIDHYCTGQWYLLVLEQLKKQGFLDDAEAWFVSDVPTTFEKHGVTVRCFKSFSEMARQSGPTDILWVRGKCAAYLEVLNRMPARLRVYYSASKRFVAKEWNHFDAILVDDSRHIEPVKRLSGSSAVCRVIKTTDPAVFRPLPGVEKIYDLCMIGGMHVIRKNYAALVRLLQSNSCLTAVVIGKRDPVVVQELNATKAKISYLDFLGREALNRTMNQSRIGFVPCVLDAAPRVIVEFMSAGVPVLLNAAILGGREYITPQTGVLASEEGFQDAVRSVLMGERHLDPRKGFEDRFRPEVAGTHLGTVLAEAMTKCGRESPTSPPGMLQRILARPMLMERNLTKCWREIEMGAAQ